MAKKESSLLNMVLTLIVITSISAVSLGYINEATLGPKAASRLQKKLDAIASVVPAFDNNPAEEMYKLEHPGGLDSIEVYPAKQAGELVGVAISTSSNRGYSGDVKIMVGFTPDGVINSISVLDQKETPGLGTKMTESKFKDQFNDKNPSEFKLSVKKDGGDVDAITAATISSRAFCDAATVAYKAYMSQK